MRTFALLTVALLSSASVAADLKDIDPNVFPEDDPRAKELPRMMWNDAQKRMQEANLRETKAFADVTTKEQWENYRDVRIAKLKESLGTWPEVPKNMKVEVTRTIDGDGFVIQCVLYETRPEFWVSANLYLPSKPPEKMPGIIISHSHHTPKEHGELQDMGMTWARSGVAVLIRVLEPQALPRSGGDVLRGVGTDAATGDVSALRFQYAAGVEEASPEPVSADVPASD